MTEENGIQELSYEDAFQQLEEVVELLEAGELPLDRALEEFQRGQALAARCSQLLEAAELKLRRMVEDEVELSIKDNSATEDM